MTRSTLSRRARNSASVMTGRRRPASRPSRRRCFLASRRVEPLTRCGSVMSSGSRGLAHLARRCSAGSSPPARPSSPVRRRVRRRTLDGSSASIPVPPWPLGASCARRARAARRHEHRAARGRSATSSVSVAGIGEATGSALGGVGVVDLCVGGLASSDASTASARPRRRPAASRRAARRRRRPRLPRSRRCSARRRMPATGTSPVTAARSWPAAASTAPRRAPKRPPRRFGVLLPESGSLVLFSLSSTISGALLRPVCGWPRHPLRYSLERSRAVRGPANPSLLRPAGCLCRHVSRCVSPLTADAVHPQSLLGVVPGAARTTAFDYRTLSQGRRGSGMPQYEHAATPPLGPDPSRSPSSSSSPGRSGSSRRSSSALEKVLVLADPEHVPSCNVSVLVGCSVNLDSWQGSRLRLPQPVHRPDGLARRHHRRRRAPRRRPVRPLVLDRASTSASPARSSSSSGSSRQSIYVLGVLCPWCMLTWAVTIPMFWVVTLHNLRDGTYSASGTRPAARRRAGTGWIPLITVVSYAIVVAARAGAA